MANFRGNPRMVADALRLRADQADIADAEAGSMKADAKYSEKELCCPKCKFCGSEDDFLTAPATSSDLDTEEDEY